MKSKLELRKEKYTAQLKKIGVPVNKALLDKVADMLGPANHKIDAMFVAASDPKELDRVYKNFLVKKLGCKDEKKGRKMIASVVEKMSSVRKKYRGVFYYLLAKKMGLK